MATQKQRRRREKEKRHEYDLIEIDEEGNERVLGAGERKPAEPPSRVTPSKGAAQPARRRGEPQPPSWQRAMRRAAIFGPLFFIFVLLTSPERNVGSAIAVVLPLIVIFVPMSYYMDRLAYRLHLKRQAKARESRGRGARPR